MNKNNETKKRTNDDRAKIVLSWMKASLGNKISLEAAAKDFEISSGALRGYRKKALAGEYGKKVKKRSTKLHKKIGSRSLARVKKPKSEGVISKTQQINCSRIDYRKLVKAILTELK